MIHILGFIASKMKLSCLTLCYNHIILKVNIQAVYYNQIMKFVPFIVTFEPLFITNTYFKFSELLALLRKV